MSLKARIKWTFKPSDYFEEPFQTEFEGIQLEIKDGEIIAELDLDKYEETPDIHESLTNHIEGLFKGAMLLSHQDFKITAGGIEKDRPDGGQDIALNIQSTTHAMVTGRLDLVVRDADGKVISDTRQDRILAKRNLALLVASKRGSDETLDEMIKSYSSAVKDPANELIYLYEIRDALVARFGDEEASIRTIGISSKKWKTLGRLANFEPLNQGRHRGGQTELRDATEQELEEARSIALEMIKKYIEHLP